MEKQGQGGRCLEPAWSNQAGAEGAGHPLENMQEEGSRQDTPNILACSCLCIHLHGISTAERALCVLVPCGQRRGCPLDRGRHVQRSEISCSPSQKGQAWEMLSTRIRPPPSPPS